MFDDQKGPIEHFSWGKFIINGEEHSKSDIGKTGVGKDIRMIGLKVSKWKERSGHMLDKDMIAGIYDKNIDILIIGTGVYGMIECPEKVQKSVKKNGVKKLELLYTQEACKLYNEYFNKGKKVALLAHGTC